MAYKIRPTLCIRCKVGTDFYSGVSPYCKECTKENNKQHYQKHREKRLAEQNAYYERNKDMIKANIKIKYKSNPEYFRQRDTNWRTSHPEIKNAGRYRYKARKIGALGAFTAEEWLELCHKHEQR